MPLRTQSSSRTTDAWLRIFLFAAVIGILLPTGTAMGQSRTDTSILATIKRNHDTLAAATDSETGKVKPEVVGPGAIPPGRSIFRDAVAIVGNGEICSGVLIDETAVLTAAHCVCNLSLDTAGVVAFGMSLSEGMSLSSVDIVSDKTAIYEQANIRQFCTALGIDEISTLRGKDLALLFLQPEQVNKELNFKPRGYSDAFRFKHVDAEDIDEDQDHIEKYDVAPARIASPNLYLATLVSELHVVGFGIGNSGAPGFKLFAPVKIASKICGHPDDRAAFSCAPGREAVLIDEDGVHDTCGGDSGGPVYIVLEQQYFLIGITSRAVTPGSCGRGGVYSLITPAVTAWLRENDVYLHSVRFPSQ